MNGIRLEIEMKLITIKMILLSVKFAACYSIGETIFPHHAFFDQMNGLYMLSLLD